MADMSSNELKIKLRRIAGESSRKEFLEISGNANSDAGKWGKLEPGGIQQNLAAGTMRPDSSEPSIWSKIGGSFTAFPQVPHTSILK